MRTREQLIRALPVEVRKAPKGESFDHEFYASTGQVDRYGEVIKPSAFEASLKQFLELNPVILFAHNHRSLPVGKAVHAEVDRKGLKMQIKWAPTQLGQEIGMLYDHGFMRSLSVGFIPLEWIDHTEAERAKGAPWRTYTAVDLLETSAVPVPANPGAVIVNSFDGAIDVPDVERALSEAEGKQIATEHVRDALNAIRQTYQLEVVSYDDAHKDGCETTDDDAPWDERKAVRAAKSHVNLAHMAALRRKDGESKAAFAAVHHTADEGYPVSRKAVTHIISLLNADDCPWPQHLRKGMYEHMRRHLEDDFHVAAEHIAELKSSNSEEEPMKIELSPELKGMLDEIVVGVKGIATKVDSFEARLAAVETKMKEPTPPPAPEPAAASASDPAQSRAESEDDVVVLDFDVNAFLKSDEADALLNGIAARIFGAPTPK